LIGVFQEPGGLAGVEKDLTTTEDSEDTENDVPRTILGALCVLGG
jgi:hypothetical protein